MSCIKDGTCSDGCSSDKQDALFTAAAVKLSTLSISEEKPTKGEPSVCVAAIQDEKIAKPSELTRGQSPTSPNGVTLTWAVPKIAEGAADSCQVKCAAERVRLEKPREKKAISLQEVVVTVCDELNKGSINFERVREAMESYDASGHEWKRYAFFDAEKKYTRNLIATDNKTFTLMLLCWNPMKGSPVHDHSGSECFLRVIAGHLREVMYEPIRKGEEDKPLTVRGSSIISNPTVAFINDGIGLHKIENPTDRPAVTLHLYLPPYTSCKCFLDETGKACTASVTFHSENGKLVSYGTRM